MKKILIVEDELAYIKLLRDQLHEAGYHVVEATDGKEGLKTAIEEKPDVILLDVRLPVLDGTQMLERLRKDAYGKHAKVIMLTNHEPDEALIARVVTDKPAYYFVKSETSLAMLLQKIKACL